MQSAHEPEPSTTAPTEDHTRLDTDQFRQALSQFATGITVIGTRRSDGQYIGLTVNSFNSVSLSPPLVLWSLSKKTSTHDSFLAATHYGVSVLSADQENLSHHFYTVKGDRFAGIDVIEGLNGVPLIPHALAHFECKIRNRHDEGDHVILVGEVLRCSSRDGEALVYRARKYFRN